MEKICVLMTTYNPKKYVIEQVHSILNQKNVEVELIIRDDGSSQIEYLSEIEKYDGVTVLYGKNVGVANNIMTLINYAKKNKKEFEFFAYSDQDDVWLDNKLLNGINILKNFDSQKPNLYYTNLQVVNENLEFSHYLFKKNVVKNTFGQSLSQVFCFACTCVFNFKMIETLDSVNIQSMGFDSLIYYTAILFGDLYYDDNSYIFYRQHGDNVSGQHKKGFSYLVDKICSSFKKENNVKIFKNNALFLKHTYGKEMTPNDLKLLDIVINYDNNFSSKLKLLFNSTIRAGYYPKDLYRFCKIIINSY